jgi:hypothetical protein
MTVECPRCRAEIMAGENNLIRHLIHCAPNFEEEQGEVEPS